MKTYTYDCVVIGTGAAGYNAACRLQEWGKKVVVITEGVKDGTSRNTGSDKQTYYKLGLGGDAPDSVRQMAQNLFDGGCVDGDNALCEAALSSRCFLHLCELGVPFPVNRYGEYIGYKTDHDPFARATSAGPLTSKFMTEALEREAERLGVEVKDGLLAVEILTEKEAVCGLLCIEKATGEPVAFRCADIVMATGGPAGIYADSVYPECHTGMTSLALLAGAAAQNLTEWQYGLSSIAPRWNVSGTYMQVLPRLVSVDENGTEHEFLTEYFDDPYEALSTLFLKGYQWPFDPKKAENGSSRIDLMVHRERVEKNRRVYLDFTKNPFDWEEIDYTRLSEEAREYLQKAGACFGRPIERLLKMNAPAIDLYRDKGVDITAEYLEIALCAQHHNGGVAVDLWWQTTVPGLYAAGECAGTHGIARPGGSALNAGQVGSLRAAQHILHHPGRLVDEELFAKILQKNDTEALGKLIKKDDNIEEQTLRARRRMSDFAAAVRDPDGMKKALKAASAELQNLSEIASVSDRQNLYRYFKLRDTLVTQCAVLTAMLEGKANDPGRIQQTVLKNGEFCCSYRPVRPIPDGDDFFENVWRGYRENENVF